MAAGHSRVPNAQGFPDSPLGEPFAFKWVEAGVSGLARRRDWDAVELVEISELADVELEEARFGVLADGTVVPENGTAPAHALTLLASRLSDAVRPPFEAVAARQTRLEWSLAARELRIEEIELPGVRARELVVAVGPGGETELLVDGTVVEEHSAELSAAAARLERLGRSRFTTFVARARRAVADRWVVSVDPL